MQKKEFIALADKYLNGTATAVESQLMEDYLLRLDEEDKDDKKTFPVDLAAKEAAIWKQVQTVVANRSFPGGSRVHFLRRGWVRYAAAVLLLAGGALVGISLINNKGKHPDSLTDKQTDRLADISPGDNRAVLSVGDSIIQLSNNKRGISIGAAITYDDGERIADAGKLLTLATPRGGQYQAVLPDGTKVWLNAASSISFLPAFNGPQRKVKVTGEVFFEVQNRSEQPFIVQTDPDTEIAVLGTSFNVNAYEDEPSLKTTLFTGKVKVIRGNTAVILDPGDQAVQALDKPTLIDVVHNVNTEEVAAWKNGLFSLKSLDLPALMRQISRWYNIETEIDRSFRFPDLRLGGTISREVQLADLLEALKAYGIDSKMSKGKLIVYPTRSAKTH